MGTVKRENIEHYVKTLTPALSHPMGEGGFAYRFG
jgi:hypothetical protein